MTSVKFLIIGVVFLVAGGFLITSVLPLFDRPEGLRTVLLVLIPVFLIGLGGLYEGVRKLRSSMSHCGRKNEKT